MALTDLMIRRAGPREKSYRLSDGEGLFLLVQTGGGKLWQLRYRFAGKENTLSFGRYPVVSLAVARGKRDEAKRLLEDGVDPSALRKQERAASEAAALQTFGLLANEYIERLKARELAPATIRKKRWYLLYLAKPLENRPIAAITAAELLQLLHRIERSGRRETAKKMRAAISAVFRYAVVTLRTQGDPTVALKDALLPPKVVGRAAITDENRFGALLRSFEEYTGTRAIIDAMLFQILTMTRPGEVRGAKRCELDLEKAMWIIPAERMKMRREHRVPLSRQALAIARVYWPAQQDELLFPSLVSPKKWLSENAFNSVLRRMGYGKEEVTAHGFRVTASTILNDRGHEPEVIEAALAHQDPNAIRRTYNRASYWDQRVKLMQDWADLIDQFRKG